MNPLLVLTISDVLGATRKPPGQQHVNIQPVHICVLCKCNYLELILPLWAFTPWRKKKKATKKLFNLIHKTNNCLGEPSPTQRRNPLVLKEQTALSGGSARTEDFLTPLKASTRGSLANTGGHTHPGGWSLCAAPLSP